MLNPDYRDLLSAFAASGVEYVLVGAYALAAHGQPRATMHIDLLIRTSDENVERVVEALRRFGAPDAALDRKALSTPGMVVQIGIAPRRIDLLTRLTGVASQRVFASATSVEVDGILIPVIGLAELILNKRATGRPHDLIDADRLEHPRTAG